MKGVEARKLAAEVLVKIEESGAYSNLALSSAFKRKQLSERDRAFVTSLVQGVMRHRSELDEQIAAVSSQPLNKTTPMVRNTLRIAVFQLVHMDDIPSSAVLNTATEVAKISGHVGTGKFVNGVLRGYIRKREKESPQDAGDAAATGARASSPHSPEQLANKYSVSPWLVNKWLKDRGYEATEKLLKWSQSIPPLTIRVNEQGIETDALISIFENKGIKVERGKLVPSCLTIVDRGAYKGPIEKLPGYTDGLFVVQDEAAAFVSIAVDPKPGETVIDLCAAPGGKSIHLAELMEGKGKVIAIDIHTSRLNLLRKTRQRLGLTNIEIVAADGTNYAPEKLADRVLLDAPCTGTGVINRKTDLRFRRDEPDFTALVDLQRRLLTNAAKMVKPGGILVYSTCSIEPEENVTNLNWFLEKHTGFKTDSLSDCIPAIFNAHDVDSSSGFVQLLPPSHGSSGFFIARMRKQI